MLTLHAFFDPQHRDLVLFVALHGVEQRGHIHLPGTWCRAQVSCYVLQTGEMDLSTSSEHPYAGIRNSVALEVPRPGSSHNHYEPKCRGDIQGLVIYPCFLRYIT